MGGAVAMCRFYNDCLKEYSFKPSPDFQIVVHCLPECVVINYFMLFENDCWFRFFCSRLDFCGDYDFFLWWEFEGNFGLSLSVVVLLVLLRVWLPFCLFRLENKVDCKEILCFVSFRAILLFLVY